MRLAVKVAYDGTRFHGNQIQPGVRTVHGEIARALGTDARLLWAGRTDAGVSAAGNVVVFEDERDPPSLLPALTYAMEDVWLWAWAEVGADLEPRHATRRWYRYHLRTEVDARPIEDALQAFVGTHDFTAFSRLEPDVNPLRTVESARATRRGELVQIDIVGPNFLWNQVRRMVEAARRVASGSVAREAILNALRTGRGEFGTASPEPLVLMDVEYAGLAFETVDTRERARTRADEAHLRGVVLADLAGTPAPRRQ